MIYLVRKEHFNAAHRLFREEWSNEKNEEIFGKCSNPNWHGHNYDLIVTVKGDPSPETGFVINLRTLSEIIKEHVLNKVDHKNMNLDVEFMKGYIPTTENIAIAIWDQLEPLVKELGIRLHCVRLEETEKNVVEYFGK
ncbi:MAG: 6-carboxytetrahydropterin synthase [Bacteroidia bacterium]|nr:6-carboxytetrahydropterin synthase [Bacteroidia bacterium]